MEAHDALYYGSSRDGGTVLVSIVLTHTGLQNADQNLDTALSIYIPVLNTLMCPPTVIITRDTVDIILG